MNQYKSEKLSSIKDEVKEFHPLLKKLLPKLPNIIDAEYTHGSEEMGADFVLSKKDEIFQNIEYIGVIAKVGKVVQDYSEIEKQISECEIPRTFFGGKTKIRISEIWVMITEHITGGAQRKIYEKFKLRKITFIDGTRLEKLIDQYIPTFWTGISLEVGDYLTTIKTKNQEIDRNTSLISFLDHDFYIEPDICENISFGYEYKRNFLKKRPEKVNIYEKIEKQKIILGLRVIEWVNSYLFKHTSQDFQAKVFLIT